MDQRGRVLVVDDSIDIRETFQTLLELAGYEVRTADDGEQGFEVVRTWRPDVVVLDVVMPRMDGLTLLLKLRSDLKPPIPPVILCSGFDLTADEALRRGAVRFLRKPTENSDLLEAVGDALAQRSVAPDTIVRQRDRAFAARQRARTAARELVRRMEAHGKESLQSLAERAQAKVETLAAYTGIARGALAIVHGEHLIVLAATEPALPRGFDLGHALPEAGEVLETESELLLPDASAHPFASVSQALGGIRFFAGVPLLLEGGVPVGVVCLFDAQPRRIESDDLVGLHLFGRRGADTLLRFADSGDATHAIRLGYGVVLLTLFEELLDAELRILAGRGGSMEIAVVDTTDLLAVSDALARAPARERLVGGLLASTRLALFKRAEDDSAGRQLADVIAELRARGAAREAGVVDVVGGGLRGLCARDLVHVASMELECAIERGDGLRRVLIEERAS